MIDDKTGFTSPGEVATFAIITPTGSVVKGPTLVDARDLWDNVCAFKGGFAVRCHDALYFYDNAGTLKATNLVSSSAIGFSTDRGDSTRIASDIRSRFVYMAGAAPISEGAAVQLAIWNATNGLFVTNAVVSSDMDPTVFAATDVNLAVDLSDRICVAYGGKPDSTVFDNEQIIARVLQFNGKTVNGTNATANANVKFLTPSFFAFKSSDTTNSLGAIMGFKTAVPSVAMTKDAICIAAKGTVNSQGDPTLAPDTAAETTLYTVIAQPFVPGSLEGQGLTRIVPDTPVIVAAQDNQSSWEPYTSVLGNSTFLIEANTYAQDDAVNMRYVVAFQPAAGGAMKLGDSFFSDNGQPYRAQINLSRQTGNPGRVAGDKRPGATNFMAGGECSLYGFPDLFNSDGRFDPNKPFYAFMAGVPGSRDGTVQTYSLNPATLAQTMRSKAQDSAFGRCCAGTTPENPASGDQISRFGGELAGLDNGNFVSVVEDRSGIFNPDGDRYAVVATIFAPDGSIVKEAFKVSNSDIWSNVAAYRGGFAVRAKTADGTSRAIYFYDNAGTLKGQVDQAVTGQAYDTGRGDGTRIASHINSPFVFLVGSTGNPLHDVPLSVFDSRDLSFVTVFHVTEVGFEATADRVGLAVDALNRTTVAWTSQPTGYLQSQVAARVLAFDASTKTVNPLTHSFWAFINNNGTNNIRSYQMNPSMTTKQICIAAKGAINLQNHPELDANSPVDTDFYTVFSHPNPQDDPTTPVGGTTTAPTLTVTWSGSTLTISWPTSATGYTLESKASLSDATWTTVGTANPTTVTIGTGNAFYRLRK